MRIGRWLLTATLAVALIVNAVVHLRLAAPFDAIVGSLLSQGDLFRMQAAANLAAVALVVLARRRWADALAAALAIAGAALLVVSSLVPIDLTGLGLPLLFEPAWYQEKRTALVAQLVAAAAALALLALRGARSRGDRG